MLLFSQDILKISSNLVRQVNTPAFEEVIKKKAATKKVCDTNLYIILLHELPSWIKYSQGEHYHNSLKEAFQMKNWLTLKFPWMTIRLKIS